MFGLRALALSAAVSGQVCPSGKGLCDCISSFEGVVLEKPDYKLLDLPANCAHQWIKRGVGKTVAEVEADNPTLKLVKGGNTAPGDANQVCRVKFDVDSSVRYSHQGNDNAEPEYHHNGAGVGDSGDTHDYKWYVGRVYGDDSFCHFGTWGVKHESAGEEFYAPVFDLLAVPSDCTISWNTPGQVTGTLATQDETASGAIAFCERSAVCAVADANGVYHPGYAVGALKAQACTEFCQAGDCDGVCAGCDGCLIAGAPMGEGAAEGGCSDATPTTAAPDDDDSLDSSQVTESSTLAASVCLLAGLFAA